MKKEGVKEQLKKSALKIGGVLLAAVLVISGSIYTMNRQATVVPELVTFVDQEGTVSISEEETPLAKSKVTKTTKTTKKTKKIKLKKKSKKTKKTTKKKTTTKTTTKKTSSSKVKTKTVKVTTVVNNYKKGSKINKQTTTVKTTVTKTVTPTAKSASSSASGSTTSSKVSSSGTSQTAASTSSSAPVKASNVSVTSLAPKADNRVLSAYQKLGFKVNVDSSVSYSGKFDARTRTITLKRADDTSYHELGHFLAFIAGNVDTSTAFRNVYNSEKGKYTGYNKAYVTSTSSEYFAESFKDYTLNPSGLKASRPQTYAAIEAALNKVTEAQVSKVWAVYSTIWQA